MPKTGHPAQPALAWRASRAPLLVALGLLLGAGALWWLPVDHEPADPAQAPPAGAMGAEASGQASDPTAGLAAGLPAAAALGRAASAAQRLANGGRPAAQASGVLEAAAAPRIQRQRDAQGELSADLADHVNEGNVPTMAEVIRRLQAAGVHSGLGAFNPPGTRPPMLGLAVPEDYALPPGYVRHHQATDDGQRIEAILMFAPDHPLLEGQKLPAASRVVPPELAPPGLPIRRIELPAPLAGRPGP